MIEVIDDMPAGTIGFRGSGEIEEDDLQAVAPAVRDAVAGGEVRLLLVTGEGFDGGQVKELISRIDRALDHGLGHRNDWKRVAIATDSGWLRRSHRIWGRLVPVDTKLFGLDDEAAARAWLSEDQR